MDEIEEALLEIKQRRKEAMDSVALLQAVSSNIRNLTYYLEQLRKPKIIYVPRLSLFARIMLSLFTAAYVTKSLVALLKIIFNH